jgi:hypothetical protein
LAERNAEMPLEIPLASHEEVLQVRDGGRRQRQSARPAHLRTHVAAEQRRRLGFCRTECDAQRLAGGRGEDVVDFHEVDHGAIRPDAYGE